MSNVGLLCNSCRRAPKSGGKAIARISIGNPTLAFLYGRCRRYEPKATTTNIINPIKTHNNGK